jgi:putative peptidoglycan binding protein
MLRLIAILTGFCFALAVSVSAAEKVDEAAAKKPAQKSKAVVQKQQFAPKQQTGPSKHVQTLHAQHPQKPITNTTPPLSKQRHVVPTQPNTAPMVQSKKIQTSKQQKLQTKEAPATNVQASTAPTTNVQSNNVQTNKVKLNKQALKNIQAQHVNFRAKPITAITSAQFNPNYRIQAAQNWNGTQYNAFRSYQPQWHDQGWWRSRYNNHLSLIGGGWYYWDNGYWYPAWGYDEAAAYYPYDGPIYVGPRARPFDQIVADVQAVLQEQGYYRGEVDGLVGPLTQEALAAYQAAQGLPPTAAIDQPTLYSLGLG